MNYKISFKKFKENCFYNDTKNECSSKFSHNWKCSKKLCPILNKCMHDGGKNNGYSSSS